MTSPFNPRDVEVLALALPPQGANVIGRAVRDLLVKHAKRLTPGKWGIYWTYQTIFFPQLEQEGILETPVAHATGQDEAFFSELAVVMLCHQMSRVTTKLRPQLLVANIEATLSNFSAMIRQTSYQPYCVMALWADTPIRPALLPFAHEPVRTTAKQHYLAGLTSPTWVKDKLLQYGQGSWPDRDWELYHHFIKLIWLGALVTEIDDAIRKMKDMKLPVPPELDPGVWPTYASWLGGGFSGADVAEANGPILEVIRSGHRWVAKMPEGKSFDFTAGPGQKYRQPPPSSCFAPGTRVLMSDASLRPIEQIAAGDTVQTPGGARQVVFRPAPLRHGRTLLQFAGTRFAFSAAHPFLVAPSQAPSAAYAAAAPDALARNVPTLSQFGITPLNGAAPAVLLRHTANGDVPFPAPAIHDVPGLEPDVVYDLFLDTGPDGRSEYYAGDENVQLLVSSEVPRFAAAPETTAVVLHVLRQAGPAVLKALASTPDSCFEDLLCVGLDSLAANMMSTIGPQLKAGPDSAPQPVLRGADSATELALSVHEFAASLAAAAGDSRRMGILVEQFTARFGPQFMAVLAMPWRTFELAESEIANMLAVTPYSVELFRPGPPVEQAEIEVALVRGRSRSTRRLRAAPGAPADRWYYSVDAVAYFPEWAPPGPAAAGQPNSGFMTDAEEDQLWQLEIALQPDAACRMVLPLPRAIADGYQEFRAPLAGAHGETVGQTVYDVRLLTLEAYAAEINAREAARKSPATSLTPLADRLARLAADFVETRFAEAVIAFRDCALTT